jgi:hypothetical protein
MDRRTLLGKINYAGYCKTAETTHDGKPLPAWENLSEKTQESWITGAESVVRATSKEEISNVEERGRNGGPEDCREAGADAARVGNG